MEKIKFNIDDYKKEVQESNKECIDTILCTKRLSQDDKLDYTENLNKLYDFCKLNRPENIVFVSSPILLAFSSAAARYYWNEVMSKTDKANSATDSATNRATRNATYDATRNATYIATYDATYSATYNATRSATDSATYNATISATRKAIDNATDSATRNATYNATDNATRSATRSATFSATDSATYSATYNATRSATRSATYSATYNATDSATRSATYSATISATDSATEISTGIIVPENYIICIFDFFKSMNVTVDENLLYLYIKGCNSIYQGGNNWASWDYYLNFYRKIGKPIPGHDYTGFDLWSKLNIAGARVLERDFAMISEKPISIVMKNDLAHNLQGPAVEFMDGVKYYMAYGNFIPSWIVTTPIKEITKEKILNEKNVDHRRYLIERMGIEKYIDILGGANVLDVYESKIGGKYELLQIDINGEKCNYLKMINQTEFVYHIEGVTNECKTVKDAIMFRNGMKSFAEPKYLS